MHDITLYFVGGSNVILQGCNDECAKDIIEWLDREDNTTYKIDIPSVNRTKVFRKELILFIDVD